MKQIELFNYLQTYKESIYRDSYTLEISNLPYLEDRFYIKRITNLLTYIKDNFEIVSYTGDIVSAILNDKPEDIDYHEDRVMLLPNNNLIFKMTHEEYKKLDHMFYKTLHEIFNNISEVDGIFISKKGTKNLLLESEVILCDSMATREYEEYCVTYNALNYYQLGRRTMGYLATVLDLTVREDTNKSLSRRIYTSYVNNLRDEYDPQWPMDEMTMTALDDTERPAIWSEVYYPEGDE